MPKIVSTIVLGLVLIFLSSAPTKAMVPLSLIVDARAGGFSYAYAPSIIREDGKLHLFFCSQADTTQDSTNRAPGAWDFIRYTSSTDGVNWTAPIIKVMPNQNVNPATGMHVNYAACDPSLVYYQGYYYLYFSNSVQTNPSNWIINQTQVSVARSTTIDGEYLTYTKRGTWEKFPLDTAYIVNPTIFRSVPFQGYGAGQQSVVSLNGTLYMWYRDDSNDPNNTAMISTYLIKSTDPVHWDTSTRQRISVDDAYSVDIKYDPIDNQFVMPRVANMHTANTFLDYATSPDGLTWAGRTTVVPLEGFTPYANNPGLESDREGHLLPGPKLFAFAAPYDLAHTDTFGAWNLYGYFAGNIPPLTATTTIPGDLNTDGHVDIFDYNLLVSKFGNPYTIFDYNNIVANYGK